MNELANCSRCGNIFVKGIRNICHDCYKKEEEAFRVVYTFLKDRENREATMNEIVEATKIEEKLIIKFVKEGRLQPSKFPNLGYPCEKCGTKITSGKLCSNCTEDLKKELELHEEMEEKAQQRKEKMNTYYAINNRNNKSL